MSLWVIVQGIGQGLHQIKLTGHSYHSLLADVDVQPLQHQVEAPGQVFWQRQLKCAGEEGQGLTVGVLVGGVDAGEPRIVALARHILGVAVVVGQQRQQRRAPVIKRGRIPSGGWRRAALVPLRDAAVQRVALGVQQRLVRGLLGQDVGEAVGRLGAICERRREFLRGQRLKVTP